jgi:hypothetical protein
MAATPAIVLPAIIPTDDFREFWTSFETLELVAVIVGMMKVVVGVAMMLVFMALAAEVVVLITSRTTE